MGRLFLITVGTHCLVNENGPDGLFGVEVVVVGLSNSGNYHVESVPPWSGSGSLSEDMLEPVA